jgi:hypothetical protein
MIENSLQCMVVPQTTYSVQNKLRTGHTHLTPIPLFQLSYTDPVLDGRRPILPKKKKNNESYSPPRTINIKPLKSCYIE